MYNLNVVERGIAQFLDNELLSIMPDEVWKKVLIGTGISLIIKNLDNVIDKFKDHPIIQFTGVIGDNNQIDVDKIVEVLRDQIPDQGMRVELPVIGNSITFHREDVDILHSCILECS